MRGSAEPAPIRLRVNGVDHVVSVDPEVPLLYVLRNDLALNGPKYGCGLGQCGACTVLLDGRTVRSCLLKTGSVGNRSVLTLEGLGTRANPHALQIAFIAEQAGQCGYCINGMIMTALPLLLRNPTVDAAGIASALRHNLCRCGAHVEIVRAIARAAAGAAKWPHV